MSSQHTSAEVGASRAQQVSRYVASIPMLAILILTLLAATGETLHSRLLQIGGETWPDYFKLRLIDYIQEPSCEPIQDIESLVDREVAKRQTAADDDVFGDVFGGEVSRDSVRDSIEARLSHCDQDWDQYNRLMEDVDWKVRLFASVEVGLSKAVTLVTGNRRVLLGLMLLFCAAAATMRRLHIALRPVETRMDEFATSVSQVMANGILLLSAFLYRQQEFAAAANGMEIAHLFMHNIWVAGFGFLTAVSIFNLFRPSSNLAAGGTPLRALLSVPLYCWMTFATFIQFSAFGFYHGIAVYLNMLAEMSTLFLNIGLYVWVGMLLARTHLPQLIFNVVRVWRLPPKWLGVVVLALTAYPTAYSGASGIFILAAGMALYREMRRAGASEQMSLAVTAIAGSMGTMLRPCLLVVIVATLNNSVTTDELFDAGLKVLLVTLSLYTVYVFLIGGKQEGSIAPLREAIPGTFRALVPVLPYIAIFAIVILLWQILLNRGMDEFSAPAILPMIMLLIVAYERLIKKSRDPEEVDPSTNLSGAIPPKGFGASALRATDESTALIGALLMLMALSVSTGGLVERSGLLELFPETFSSALTTVTLLVGMLIFVGMIMDPYGAAILVNATLAPIAMQNGIEPIHFWVMTLLAFEMGYLTPPVALNHLLTRQIVGAPTSWESLHGTFWQRNFRIIFPLIVMGTALLLVAYVPLYYQVF